MSLVRKVRRGIKVYTPHTSTALFGQVSALTPTFGSFANVAFAIAWAAGESLRHDFKTARMLRTTERRCEAMYAGDNERRTYTQQQIGQQVGCVCRDQDARKFEIILKTQLPIERNLYPHPLAKLLWERTFENTGCLDGKDIFQACLGHQSRTSGENVVFSEIWVGPFIGTHSMFPAQ